MKYYRSTRHAHVERKGQQVIVKVWCDAFAGQNHAYILVERRVVDAWVRKRRRERNRKHAMAERSRKARMQQMRRVGEESKES